MTKTNLSVCIEGSIGSSNIFSLAALNVLVFNNGRIVKLAGFGSAIHVEDIPSMGAAKLKGYAPFFDPFFAAPEVTIYTGSFYKLAGCNREAMYPLVCYCRK